MLSHTLTTCSKTTSYTPAWTAVTAILLISAKAARYNSRTGRVVDPTEGAAIKPGR